MTAAIVAGAVANKAGNGGATWTRLSWALGLAELGFDVHFVEQLTAGAPPRAVAYFTDVMGDAGLREHSTLLGPDGSTAAGRSVAELAEIAADAAVLLNISGHLQVPEVVKRVGTSVFIDLDPGYTQLWHAAGTAPLAAHDHFYTVGELVGTPRCPLPVADIGWRPIRQPVVLADWPEQPMGSADRFTTVASWRGPYGPLDHGGRSLGAKVHEFRRFLDLPRRVAVSLEIALDIDDADHLDRTALTQHGWLLRDPAEVAAGPESFRRYVQGSAAEFSVAQAAYVHTTTGWFSDRTVRYLASGRPAVVQDTGFSEVLPTGEGLLTFRAPDEAVAAIETVGADYERHARAAAALARDHFAAPVVLGRLCEEVDVAP